MGTIKRVEAFALLPPDDDYHAVCRVSSFNVWIALLRIMAEYCLTLDCISLSTKSGSKHAIAFLMCVVVVRVLGLERHAPQQARLFLISKTGHGEPQGCQLSL